MADRDAEFVLKATDKTGPAVHSAADGFEKVSDKADKAKRSIDDLGDEAGQVSRKLLEARAAAATLAKEFDKTGDTKILKDFEKVNRDAAKLGRVMKTLKFDAPEVKTPDGILGGFVKLARKTGMIAGDVAVEGFGDAFKALGTASPAGSYIIAGLVGAAAAAAPFVAAAVEGAVTAGIGAAGIAGGLILAAQDPRVGAAYAGLADRITPKLKAAAAPFVTDLLLAAPKFEAVFDRLQPRIQKVFAGLAGNLGPIIDNAIAAVDRLGPSIERAALVGGKILQSLSNQLPGLAGSIGRLLDAFSASGPGAAQALGLIVFQLRGLIELIALGARGSAPLLNLLGKLVEVSGATGGTVKHLDTIQKDAGTSAGLAAGQYDNLAFSMSNTADAATNLNDSINRLFNEQMNLDQANLAVKQGFLNLKESIKENGKSLDDTSQKGLNNIGVIQQQIQNFDRQRQAAIDAGNGTVEASDAANAAYVTQLEGLRKMLYSLGLNKAKVDELINSYEDLAKPSTKTFTTVFKTQGSIPKGYSDQSTGHSRTGATDYGGLDGWAPARFNGSARAEFAQTGGGGVHQPAAPVSVEQTLNVSLDGQPFKAMTVRTVDAASKRSAWRAKVGKR